MNSRLYRCSLAGKEKGMFLLKKELEKYENK